MQWRRFGKTGIRMPVLTCGGMRYQHAWSDVPPGEIPAASQRNLEACVERALALGINHIETARGYGSSERQLGRILPRLPRDGIIVQTKIGPTADPEAFLASFDTSLERLGLDCVDLLALHGINNRELLGWSLRPGGCLEAARRLRDRGRCRFVGFSTHAAPDVITAAIESGGFDYVNLHGYYVNPFAWPCVEAAARRDMGVFIISPNDKGGRLFEPPPKLVELCRPLSPMAFNDLYCLARPGVHTLSIGAARPEDFDEHVRALEQEDGYGLARAIAARLDGEMARVLGADWAARWHEGLPPWEDVPGGINLREILRLWNLAKGLDLLAYARARYNLLGNGGHWFPGQNAGGAAQHDLRDALRQSPFADRIPAVLAEAHAWFHAVPAKRLSESET